MSRLPSRFSDAELAEGLDRKQLGLVRKRFLGLNRDRLLRLSAALRERQRDFVNVLPLLLHINHPLLPGFISSEVPCSIADYSPPASAIAAAKRLSKSFVHEKRARARHDIQSLFLMGSAGTLGHSGESDLDLWVVYRAELSPEELAALRAKLDVLAAWGRDCGLEVHAFLMEPDSFRAELRQSVDAEDCGTTQHYLLLDEFYRTALLLAGKPPLWWMVPPDEEGQYEAWAHNLLHKRYLRAGDFIDFGGLATLPANEFFGAALWQLYKAIDSPYKSVLKLLLMESYAQQFPSVQPLSLSFKRALYASAEPDTNELDPYLMMFRRVESYLAEQGDDKRIDLVRRCFYLKLGERLSLPLSGTPSWRRERLSLLVASWGWPHYRLVELDNRRRWKVQWATVERKLLVNELTLSYRFLSNFARAHASLARISARDLNLLGRKLYASFERRAGKVEFVNPQVAPDLSEDYLSFVYSREGGEPVWLLFAGEVRREDEAVGSALRRSREFVELLAWAWFNGLLLTTTQLSLSPDAPLSPKEAASLVRDFHERFAGALPQPSDEDFQRPARVLSETVFVNLGTDSEAARSRAGMTLVSSRTDALAYGGFTENLVQRFDAVTINSWREVMTRHAQGPRAVLDYLRLYGEELLAQERSAPRLSVRCHSTPRAEAIARRVATLLAEFGLALSTHGEALRYLLQVGAGYALFSVEGKSVRVLELPDAEVLRAALADPLPERKPLVLDSQALSRTPLPLFAARQQPDRVQLVLQPQGQHATLYLLDEHGALFQIHSAWHDRDSLLNPYRLFLDAVAYRQNAAGGTPVEARYYELSGLGEKRELVPIRSSRSDAPPSWYEIQAIAERDGSFTLYCGGHEFSALEYGPGLFRAVAVHILAQRQGSERYPVYLSDLDLSARYGDARLSTGHYLHHKLELEAALNQALTRP